MSETRRVLDLFAGLGGWSAAFRQAGWEVVTVDLEPRFRTTIIGDVLDPLVRAEIAARGPYPVVLASPPCEGFSVMNIGKNWHGDGCEPACRATHLKDSPKTDSARLAVRLVEAAREIIDELAPDYFLIENPRAKLRVLPVVADLERRTVTYCQLGERRMKPTDLWGGFPPSLVLPPPCRNGDPCHVSAPRGSRTPGSTQGIKGSADRAEIPFELSLRVLAAVERDMVAGGGTADGAAGPTHENARVPAASTSYPQLELPWR